jgi:hypothetical protein
MKAFSIVTVCIAIALFAFSGKKAGAPPAEPDYSKDSSWAALPSKKDSADLVPVSWLKDAQDSAKVDVFYIHPTTYIGGLPWNADVSDESLNNRTDKNAIKHQASVFNGSCKVYAPRYRQAVLRAFFITSDKEDAQKALDLAYSDVKKAFQYYLDHYNQGRPVIIAGHSQGAHHAMRLLKDFFDGKPLQQKLVAAYPVGMYFSCDTLSSIGPCTARGQTGVFATWNTFRWGSSLVNKQKFTKGACCTNPLTWTTTDEELAPADRHRGSLPFTFDRIDSCMVRTQRHGSALWCDRPKKDGYMLIASGESYHVGDINLFWMDIREHVALQVKNYLEKK